MWTYMSRLYYSSKGGGDQIKQQGVDRRGGGIHDPLEPVLDLIAGAGANVIIRGPDLKERKINGV